MPDQGKGLKGAAVAIVAAALIGCGPPKMQPRPESTTEKGATSAEFERDSFQCQRAVTYWLFDRSLYLSCMRAHGHVTE